MMEENNFKISTFKMAGVGFVIGVFGTMLIASLALYFQKKWHNEYTQKIKISAFIIQESTESWRYLREKSIDCNTKAPINKNLFLNNDYQQVIQHMNKTLIYMDQYIAINSKSSLSNSRLELHNKINLFEKNADLFKQCSTESKIIFSEEQWSKYTDTIVSAISNDIHELQKKILF